MRRARAWMGMAGLVCFLAILTAGVSTSKAQQPGGAPQQGVAVRTAGEANRNIQILRDLPADQVVPTMRFFAYSLGVECEFCHVDGDDSKDDKPQKIMARAMINMEMAINRDSFYSRTMVTCYTCHRGSTTPGPVQSIESTKIIPGGTPPPPPPAAAGRGGAGGGAAGAGRGAPAAAAAEPPAPVYPSTDAILAKYAQALGGEQALRRITSRTVSGTRDTAGRNTQDVPWARATFEMYEKAPNLRTTVLHAANGQTTSNGFDGNSSWTQNANGAVAEANGIALARAKRVARFYEPLDLKQEYARMEVRGIEKISGRDAYLVVGVPAGEGPERLYFDKESGLLVRRIGFNENMAVQGTIQTDYLDYRDANGVKYPATIKIFDVMANPLYTELHLTKVDFAAAVDAAKFVKPVSTPPAGRGGGAGRGAAQ